MELQKLYKDKQELQRDKNMYDKRINALQDTLGVKAINYSSERVQGGMVRNSQEDAILQIADLQTLAYGIQKQIDAIDDRIEEELKDIDESLQPIIEKKATSNDKNWVIASELGISDRTFYRKMKIIRENGINVAQNEPKSMVK
jgi:septum formation inhibitor MinC